MFDYDPEKDTPEAGRRILLKAIRISVGIDLAMVAANLLFIALFMHAGGLMFFFVIPQALFLIVSGRSFLDGLDEMKRVKELKFN